MQSYLASWRGWKAVVAALVAVGLIGALVVQVLAEAESETNTNRRADPARFLQGELNTEAVAAARSFQEFPLVWLGDEFNSFKLTEFLHREGEGYNSVYLIYGACEPLQDALEPSCVPPLEIIIDAPGSVPAPNDIEERVAGPETTRRGVIARMLSGSMHLWTGGVVVIVDANSEHMESAIAELETVNHEARGEPAIGKGENLSGLAGR